jgi:hypothetical protein
MEAETKWTYLNQSQIVEGLKEKGIRNDSQKSKAQKN